MKQSLQEIKILAEQIALKAGNAIKEVRAQANFSVSFKSNIFDLVTSADLLAEKIIVGEVHKSFPDHRILSEESYQTLDKQQFYEDHVWIIDPIDGTVNYAHGCLHVCISIAYAFQGEVLVGVVYAPFLNELFIGVKGQGATLNGEPIKVSAHGDLKNCIISTGEPYERGDVIGVLLNNFKMMLSKAAGIRRSGSAALDLCWVACGRLDGHYELKLKPWDIAAGSLIAREAGATIGSMKGIQVESDLPPDLRSANILVSAPGIFNELHELLGSDV